VRRTSDARNTEAKKSQSLVIPNAAFFIAAEESQSAPAARVSHSASATSKDENHPIKTASINFDQ